MHIYKFLNPFPTGPHSLSGEQVLSLRPHGAGQLLDRTATESSSVLLPAPAPFCKGSFLCAAGRETTCPPAPPRRGGGGVPQGHLGLCTCRHRAHSPRPELPEAPHCLSLLGDCRGQPGEGSGKRTPAPRCTRGPRGDEPLGRACGRRPVGGARAPRPRRRRASPRPGPRAAGPFPPPRCQPLGGRTRPCRQSSPSAARRAAWAAVLDSEPRRLGQGEGTSPPGRGCARWPPTAGDDRASWKCLRGSVDKRTSG